jgi:hypothetical protein
MKRKVEIDSGGTEWSDASMPGWHVALQYTSCLVVSEALDRWDPLEVPWDPLEVPWDPLEVPCSITKERSAQAIVLISV